MVEPVRHRQTKGAATDMFVLPPPRHTPTLPLDPERSVVLRAVRCRGHRRAHQRQNRRLEEEGEVDGWRAAARVWSAGPQARHDRQRGGYRSIDLPPLCRTRLSPIVT